MTDTLPKQAPTAQRRRGLHHWGYLLPSLLLILSCYVPLVRPLTGNDLDWPPLLSEAHIRGLSFGRDIVFTFGPWGFTWAGYHPRTFALTCITWMIVALAAWWLLIRLAAPAAGESERKWGLIVFLLVLPLGGDYTCAPDVRLLVLPGLLVLYHFFIEPRPNDPAKLAIVAVIGLVSLVKFTSLVAGAVAVSIVYLDQVTRRDYRLHLPLLWLAMLTLSWLLAGQSITDFPLYLRHSLEATAGYPDAMGLISPNEWSQLSSFILVAALLISFFLWISIRTLARRAILFMAGIVALLFIFYRCGFVRHDLHELTATMLLLACAVSGFVATRPLLYRFNLYALGIASIVLAAIIATRSLWDWHRQAMPEQLVRNVTSVVTEVIELARIAAGKPPSISLQWQRAMAHVRKTIPLPDVKGTVDLFPRTAVAVLANGLDYRPRPTLQSYVAMTPQHAALNAQALAAEDGPVNLFLSIDRENDHFITLDDSRCWLRFLTHYRFEQLAGNYLHLLRRPIARSIRRTFDREIVASLGQRVELQTDLHAKQPTFLWAEIDAPLTATGWVMGQLYRPPPLYIRTWTHDGKTREGRLVRAIASDGFLLGPVPVDQQSLIQMLADDPDPQMLNGLLPQSLIVGTNNPTLARWTIAPQVRIRLYRLDITTLN